MKAGQGRKRQHQEKGHESNIDNDSTAFTMQSVVDMARRQELHNSTAQIQGFATQNVPGMSPQDMLHAISILTNAPGNNVGVPVHGNVDGIQGQALPNFFQNTLTPAQTIYSQQAGINGGSQSLNNIGMNQGMHAFGMPAGIQSTNETRRLSWANPEAADAEQQADIQGGSLSLIIGMNPAAIQSTNEIRRFSWANPVAAAAAATTAAADAEHEDQASTMNSSTAEHPSLELKRHTTF
jgi:hypothetical protein